MTVANPRIQKVKCPYCSARFEFSDGLAHHLLASETCVARHSRSPVALPQSSLANAVWFEWGFANMQYRLADLNGRPTLEILMGNDWKPIALDHRADPLLHGVAKLIKRLSRAEARIDHLKGQNPTGEDYTGIGWMPRGAK